ncbi:MAG: hypothetical protein M3Q75_15390, partial [Gemmatimonadota bacterium]|nr:hypothetical protein [Gemmatimonadota bacterium]
MTADRVIDQYSPLSFMEAMGDSSDPGDSALAPRWVGKEHLRRLAAYKILHSFTDNTARTMREFISNELDPSMLDSREYGDAGLVVTQTVAALLGDHVEFQTEGAEGDPEERGEDGDTGKASRFQGWIRQWAKDERFTLKVYETERNAVRLGDGVYTFTTDYERERIKCRVYDPGFYFPVIDDDHDDEFPRKVHLAWELADGGRADEIVIRRLTWEMVEVLPTTYLWDDRPTRHTCVFTDATWRFPQGQPNRVDDFDMGRADFKTYVDSQGVKQDYDQVDLKIDFIPVVHIPNTIAVIEHYGRSVLMAVLQILLDLHDADTDLKASAATTGKPPIAVSGAKFDVTPRYQAGDVWDVGENGRVTVVDTSKALAALADYIKLLLHRLSVNSRLPEALLGRVRPSEVPSGLAMR